MITTNENTSPATSLFYQVTTLDDGTTSADLRKVKITYRSSKDKDGKEIKAYPSLQVIIPALVLPGLSSLYQPIQALTLEMWCDVQDSIIKSLIDASRTKANPSQHHKHAISGAEIDLEACIAKLASSGKGKGKLSAASIKTWFDGDFRKAMEEAIMAAIFRQDVNIQADIALSKATDIADTYRTGFMTLAATDEANRPNKEQAKQLLAKLTQFRADADKMADTLDARLTNIIAPVKKEATFSVPDIEF